MEISVQSLKRADLVTVSGRIDSNSAPEMDKALKDIYGKGRYNIALDLSGVEYMSSAGLRAMVAAVRECKKGGGGVHLANPSERVSEVLSLAGLNSVFTIYEDTTTAIGSF